MLPTEDWMGVLLEHSPGTDPSSRWVSTVPRRSSEVARRGTRHRSSVDQSNGEVRIRIPASRPAFGRSL